MTVCQPIRYMQCHIWSFSARTVTVDSGTVDSGTVPIVTVDSGTVPTLPLGTVPLATVTIGCEGPHSVALTLAGSRFPKGSGV